MYNNGVMKQRQQTPESLWPYSERNGVGVDRDVSAILDGPEIYLTDAERQAAIELAHGLFNGEVGELRCASPRSLEQINTTSIIGDLATFHLDYFRTEVGQEIIAESGYSGDLQDDEQIIQHLMKIGDIKLAKSMALKSLKWSKARMADMLDGKESDDWLYDDDYRTKLNYAPEKLLGKLEDLQAYRQFYRQVRGQIRADESLSEGSRQAHMSLLEMHIARVNDQFGDLYPEALALAEQLDIMDASDPKTEAYEARLSAVVPVLSRLHKRDGVERLYGLDDLIRRIDLNRYGAAWRKQEGQIVASPISAELEALAANVGKESATELPESAERLPNSVVEKLDNTRWNSEQLKSFLETVLSSWGKLSATKSTYEEVRDRGGPAEDGLYQVISTPEQDSFSVNTVKRIVFVPESFDRNLTRRAPAGALPLAAHELAHVLQSFYDDEMSQQIPLAKIKGRRYLTLREAGGIYQEREVQQKYFGRQHPTSLHYLQALRAKLRGGNKLEVARAFYKSYVGSRQLSDKERAEARDFAVDRSLRLDRNGGHNSQPLDYVEQGLIVSQFGAMTEDEISAFLISSGSFNTKDMAALSRVDLLRLPSTVEINPSKDVMTIFIRDFLPTILAEQGAER